MIYVTVPGDTVSSISRQSGVPVWKIMHDNQLGEEGKLTVGQALLLLKPQESAQIWEDLYVTGYAYPFIEPYVLEMAFPALNELLVFSYGFTFEGKLIPPMKEEIWMIRLAWENGIEPVLVLTPFTQGVFNNQLIHTLVEERTVRDKVISNLLEVVEEKGYTGVDVDFEYVRAEDREGYAQFVGELRQAMNKKGYRVSVTLAPKTSSDQRGLLYEGIDYALLGEQADRLFLMTYGWGYSYGPPMAVAPLEKVRQVVEYALTQIPAEKLLMGIPNYGYNWTLPYEKGMTKAETIGNVEAVRIAAEYGAVIHYDESAQSPYFTYQNQGRIQEVWFEDVRSIEAKIELAKEYQLYGVGYWNLMRPFRANWTMLEK